MGKTKWEITPDVVVDYETPFPQESDDWWAQERKNDREKYFKYLEEKESKETK